MQLFNACEYLLDRNIEAGNGERLALTGPAGDVSYQGLWDDVTRLARGLRELGLEPEQRLVMVMADSPDFVTVYLAAMRIGAVPVPISTMLHFDGVAEIIGDARATIVAASPEYVDLVGAALDLGCDSVTAVVVGGHGESAPLGSKPTYRLRRLPMPVDATDTVYATSEDSPAFWLYTSGTTGTPKGAMHRHGSIPVVCETYGRQVLGITSADRCLSSAKAFFAYGLGNSVLFPLSVGAAAVLEPNPARPEVIAERVKKYAATLFFAGPTFFSNMLRAGLASDALTGVRLAVSAGEALPAALYQRWTSHFGVDIIDGIGMTEMLHIFLSNRPGDVHPGTTGSAVPGYELRLLDDDGHEVEPGSPGTLFVRGSSTAVGYWSRYDATRQVFQGEWLRTGDTYVQDSSGYYACLGRTGDMLKASGIWVSPSEVEDCLLGHPAVAQAVIVAAVDADGLEKPVACVVLREGIVATEQQLIEFCRAGLPSFKRPRRILFVDSYPTTATGKIRRVELRESATAALVAQT
jgi:benzoate-CoA ligase family protein